MTVMRATLATHIDGLREALACLDVAQVERLGERMRQLLERGDRLLVAGNGGSAAHAQHLTAELVGRYRLENRMPYSAIALHADTSSVTAIANDFGWEDVFARQVRAHARPGDALLALSTSGRSTNLLRAADAAHAHLVDVWSLTGPAPNPLADLADLAVVVDNPSTATIQEVHQVVVLSPLRSRRTDSGAVMTAHVVVIGDSLFDCDMIGTVARVCPDAPVPVVDVEREIVRPGGAGLAAILSAQRGADVVLVTALGSDARAETLRTAFHVAGIEVVDLGWSGATPEKLRVRAGGTSVVRIDRGNEGGTIGECASLADVCASASAVLVADYGRGMTSVPSVRAVVGASIPRVPVVWDPHPRGARPVLGTQLLTPNESELMGRPPGQFADLAALTTAARALAVESAAHAVGVTLGARGALLTAGDGVPLMIPCRPVVATDTCGAGDCFAASVATALAAGAVVSEAVEYAVEAASAFVANGAAASLGREHDPRTHEEEPGDAADVIRRTRRAGGTVVAAGGCFDLLHPGHIALLEAARRLGDCLVVLLNSDRSVRELKGGDRPRQPATDRAAVLRALSCVDAVEEFDTATPVPALERLRPDVFVKGGDYASADLAESHALESWGAQVVVVPYLAGRSTTRLLQEAAGHGP